MPPKRKSDTNRTSTFKKSRTEDANARAVALVNDILADPVNFTIPEDDEAIRKYFVHLANYIHSLQMQASSGSSATIAPAAKSPGELSAAVEKIRWAAVAGIERQMNVRMTRIYATFMLRF